VRAIGSVLHDVARGLGPDAVVTDAGSTKADVVRTAAEELRERTPRFVPGHPIAGRETSGVESAVPDLFRGARVVLTPGSETAPEAADLVRACWEACGARVTVMSAESHDRVFAAVSHLPHLLAFALVSEIVSRPDGADLLGFAAGGFRDFTRIAASSPEMWRDVALANRDAILEELDRYAARVAVFRELVAKGDGPGLQRLMTEARNARRAWTGGRRSASDE
jgi:prephenate dehydrogenase